MKKHLSSINNDYLRYANCWEDADLLIRALDLEEGDKILSIGSAGDNSFSMLASNPERVVAVDINPTQLKLIKLKKAAFQALEQAEFLEFLGFESCTDRKVHFAKVKDFLSSEDQMFWTKRLDQIEAGIIYQGKFEKYFRFFRLLVLPLVHSKRSISTLFEKKTSAEQNSFFSNSWNSLRWKTFFRIFFSKKLMGWLGRDPKFLKEVKVPVSQFILHQAEKQLSSASCQNNYFLDFILRGRFSIALPHYARPENYLAIKRNINNLEVFCGYAQDAINEYGSFNKFNLSNIFEYMDLATFRSVVKNLVASGQTKAKYAYWNLMVPRTMSTASPLVTEQVYRGGNRDHGFFYSAFHINEKR